MKNKAFDEVEVGGSWLGAQGTHKVRLDSIVEGETKGGAAAFTIEFTMVEVDSDDLGPTKAKVGQKFTRFLDMSRNPFPDGRMVDQEELKKFIAGIGEIDSGEVNSETVNAILDNGATPWAGREVWVTGRCGKKGTYVNLVNWCPSDGATAVAEDDIPF